MNIIEWWNNLNPLTKQEQEILNTCLCHNEKEKTPKEVLFAQKYGISNVSKESSKEDFEILSMEYFNRMPFCNCNVASKDLSFEISATTFINKLFETYVDDETLVISSDSELNNSKNVLLLNHYTDIRGYNIEKVINESKKYKKTFVYIIGTRNDTGEITPQLFFEEMKKTFIENNIDHTIVLDDVQGMFLVPRDYSMFDYVIGTAHAICTGFDMGIMISNEYLTGKKAYNWGSKYLESLDIILKRQSKMNIFRDVLIQYYSRELVDGKSLSQELVVPYIFHMKTKQFNLSENLLNSLHHINLLISNPTVSITNFIQLRSHWFIKDNTLLPKCINIIDNILKGEYNEQHIMDIIKGEING